jgi:hypothetical protein
MPPPLNTPLAVRLGDAVRLPGLEMSVERQGIRTTTSVSAPCNSKVIVDVHQNKLTHVDWFSS